MRAYNTIEEALEELRQGRMILVTDDPDRENEGDLICAAEFATTENVNFMATHGKGLICMPMSEELGKKLMLPQMVSDNTDNHCTAFTVSIDHVDTAFPPKNAATPQENAWKTTRNLRISVVPVTCSRSLPAEAACSPEKDTQKPPLT